MTLAEMGLFCFFCVNFSFFSFFFVSFVFLMVVFSFSPVFSKGA